MALIEIDRNAEPPIVTVTADDGTKKTWPLAAFEADPGACVAATGNGIAAPVPQSISRMQAMLALHDAGLMNAVNTIVAGADPRIQLAWANADTFTRDSPTIAALWGAMGKGGADLDNLFRAAAQIVV